MSDLTANLITALLSLVATLQGGQGVTFDTESYANKLTKAATAIEATTDTSKIHHFEPALDKTAPAAANAVFSVPFYSQFNDITSPKWKKLGCGIAGLAMLIEFYEPGSVTVDGLLDEGISAGAFLDSAGWTHAGLIGLSHKYGLSGNSRDMAGLSMDSAFVELQKVLKDGPVMVSVYYTFTPGNPIPHLVVLNGIKDGLVYYNDPAEPHGGGTITVEDFKPAWKKRYIAIRPNS